MARMYNNYINPELIHSISSESEVVSLEIYNNTRVLLYTIYEGRGLVAYNLNDRAYSYLWMETSSYSQVDGVLFGRLKNYFPGFPEIELVDVLEGAEDYIVNRGKLEFSRSGIFFNNDITSFHKQSEPEWIDSFSDQIWEDETFSGYNFTKIKPSNFRKNHATEMHSIEFVNLGHDHMHFACNNRDKIILNGVQGLFIFDLAKGNYIVDAEIVGLQNVYFLKDNLFMFVLSNRNFLIFDSKSLMKTLFEFEHNDYHFIFDNYIFFKDHVFEIETLNFIKIEGQKTIFKGDSCTIALEQSKLLLYPNSNLVKYYINTLGSSNFKILDFDEKSKALYLQLDLNGLKCIALFKFEKLLTSVPFKLARSFYYPLEDVTDNKTLAVYLKKGQELFIKKEEVSERTFSIAELMFGQDFERTNIDDNDIENTHDWYYYWDKAQIHVYISNCHDKPFHGLSDVTSTKYGRDSELTLNDWINFLTYDSCELYFKPGRYSQQDCLWKINILTGELTLYERIKSNIQYHELQTRSFDMIDLFSSFDDTTLQIHAVNIYVTDFSIPLQKDENTFLTKLINDASGVTLYWVSVASRPGFLNKNVRNSFITLKGLPYVFLNVLDGYDLMFQLHPGKICDSNKKPLFNLSKNVVLDLIVSNDTSGPIRSPLNVIFIDSTQKVQLYHCRSGRVVKTLIDLSFYSTLNVSPCFFRNLYIDDKSLKVIAIDRKTTISIDISEILPDFVRHNL